MTSVVLIVLVVIALLITLRSARRAWSDHHSLEEHQKGLHALGEMVQQSDTSHPAATSQQHVRVVDPDDPRPTGPMAPRWAAGRIWPTAPSTPVADLSLPTQLSLPTTPEERAPEPAASPALSWSPPPQEIVPPPLDHRTNWPSEWAAPITSPVEQVPEQPPAPAQPVAAAAAASWTDELQSWTQPPPSGDDHSGVTVLRVPNTPPPSVPPVPSHPSPFPNEPAASVIPSDRPVLRFDDTGGHPEVLTGYVPPLVPAAGPAPVPSHPPFVPPETATALVTGTIEGADPVRRRRKAHARRMVPSGPWLAVGGGVAAAIILVVSLLTFTGKSSPPPKAPSAAAPAPANVPPASPPTTTVSPVQLVQSDSQEATFSLSSSASIELVATARCWVEVRSGSASGPVVFTATMVGGQRQTLPSGQTLWTRLGYPPGVSIVINGTPLAAPALSTPSPYNVKIQTS
jgi:hypothetical protein